MIFITISRRACFLFLLAELVSASWFFAVEPQDAAVQMHENATLRCLVQWQNSSSSSSSSSAVTSSSSSSSSANSAWSKQVIVVWSKVEESGEQSRIAFANKLMPAWEGRALVAHDSVTLTKVTRDSAGRYECALPLAGLSRVAQLTVIANPVSVLLETNPNGPVMEGTLVTFVCASLGGYPASQFNWSMTAPSASESGQVNALALGRWRAFNSQERYGWANASVERLVTAEDNAATVACTVTNPRTNFSQSVLRRLAVYYSPKMVAKGGLRRVIENSSLSLECAATANPDNITYEWQIPDSLRSPELCARGRPHATGCAARLLRIPKVDRSMSGDFTCFASNGLNGNRKAQVRWNVLVLHAPQVVLEDNYTFREHSKMKLTCFDSTQVLQSVSSIDEVAWSFQNVTVAQHSEHVLLKAASRDAAGRYDCKLRVSLIPTDGDGQPETLTLIKSTHITVQYLPGKPQMQMKSQAEQNAVLISLGNPLRLTCVLRTNEIGEPASQIEWTSSLSNYSRVIAYGTELLINRTVFGDEAVYRCTPANTIGRGPYTSVHVKIVGAVFDKRLPSKISKRAKDSLQSAYQSLSLECSLCTQPAMNVSWLHEGSVIEPDGGRQFEITQDYTSNVNSTCKHRVHSVLRFVGTDRPAKHGLQLRDFGNYACVAQLGVERITNSSTFLEIRHKPVVDKGRFFHAKVNESVTLECVARGNPLPEVIWYKLNEIVRGVEVDLVEMHAKRSRLHLQNVTDESYCTYVCAARNEEGYDNGTVTLRHAGPPGTPSNVRATETTWESIRLDWLADDDGGSKQMFTVSYLEVDSGSMQRETKVNTSTDKHVIVSSLSWNRKYSFRIQPYNSYGLGPAISIIAQTKDLLMPILEKPIYLDNSKALSVRTISANTATNASYCLIVEHFVANRGYEGNGWRPVSPCVAWRLSQDRVPLELPSEVARTGGRNDDLRVSVCIAHRPEICNVPVILLTYIPAASASGSPPSWSLYVAAAVCGAIVVSLSGLLMLCCYCRRRRSRTETKKRFNPITEKYSYVKADGPVDLMLGGTEDVIDEQMAQATPCRLARSIPRFDIQRSTYISVETADLHPAQIDMMSRRHNIDQQLSSADTSDTSVSLLPRDAHPRFDDISAHSIRPNDSYTANGRSSFSIPCNHHSSVNMTLTCNCVQMGMFSDANRECYDRSENCYVNGNNLIPMETSPSIRLSGSASMDKSWPPVQQATMHHNHNVNDQAQFQFSMHSGTALVTNEQPLRDAELCMRSTLYRKPPNGNDQVFEVVV